MTSADANGLQAGAGDDRDDAAISASGSGCTRGLAATVMLACD